MQAKLIVTFDRLSAPDFLVKSGSIVNSMTGNSHYQEPWIGQGLTLDLLTAAYGNFQDAYHASLTKDTLKIAQRDVARIALTDLIKRLAMYLELISNGDTAMLATTGYDLRHDIVRNNSNDLLPAPADFRVTHGQLSGSLNVQVARLANAGSYEIHVAKDDPKIESNWQHAISSVTSTHIVITGLIPGQTYWLRVRGIDSNGGGVWSEPISIIVV
jgi:hypothetical protein